jgi:DNA-binding response OmpR family regulator
MSAKLTVLIAEDDPDEAFLLMEAFRHAHLEHRHVWVRDGHQVLAYLSGKPPYAERGENPTPDLVLLDLRMPGLGGHEVLRHLQGQTAMQVPVVVLSSSVLPWDEAQSRELGAAAYYVKPLDFTELVRLVRELDVRWLKRGSD